VSYASGIFNGVPDGASSDQASQDNKDYAARVFVAPFLKAESRSLRGVGVGIALTTGVHRGTLTAASLPVYVTSGQSTFFSYRSDGTREGTSIADGMVRRFSPQVYYHWGPFSIQGEYVRSSQAVRKGHTRAQLDHRASQVALTYVVTGEEASYRGVVPKTYFNPRARTWGAFEIATRYSELSVDRNSFPLFADPATSARKAQAWAGGLNWYFNRNVKVVLNYEQTFFKGGAAVGSRPTEKAVLTRFQLAY
jgi:phosphate-selective porin OprO/OprP